MTITKRLVKGSELSYAEMDSNFTDLDERTVVLETANSTSSQVTSANIGSLLNVDTTGVINGQVLKYDSNANKWKPSSDLSGGGSGGGIALTDLSLIQSADSGLGSATYNSVTGQFTIAMPDLTPYAKTIQLFTTSDVDSHLNQSNPTNGYVLSWNGSDYTWVDNGVITETDPIFTASPASTISNTKITNWDTSYGWGDHSVEGYLKSETDPIFTASPASTITNTKITNWDTSYGWGDHSTAGYLTSFTETNTSLSLATNILKYTDEAGAVTNIDLSLYLDDTNLAKLTSGTINGATGIATFLRDDASSFTVDFSQLFDDTNLSRIDSATFASGTLTLTRSDTSTASTVNLDGRYLQNLATQTTDNLSEGSTNLYYTQARFNSALSTKSTTDLSEGTNLYYTDARVDARITNAGLFDGDYNSLTNLPTLFNGQFGSLTGKPTTISGYGITDAFDGDYTNLTNKPTLFDGKFSSLTNTPTTIAGYGITDALALGTTSTTALAGDTALFDGDYTNLTNKPTIPAVLTDLSISDGTNGQVLTTDGSGNFTFQAISAGGSTTLSGLTDTTIASVQQFQSLQWSGTKWVNAYPNTQHLSNVDRLNNPTNGDTLVWNALNNQYEYSQAVVSDQALSTTDDVSFNNITVTNLIQANAFEGNIYDTNGNVLLDNTNGAASFGGNISSNGSSSFSGTVDFNGATINNLNLALGDLSNVDPVAPTTGHVLKWGGSQWAPGLSGDMPTSGGTFTGDVTFATGKITGVTDITTGPASGSPSINLGDGTGNFGNPIINFNAAITGVSGHITHIANGGFEIKSNSGGEYIRLKTYDSSHFTPLEVVGNVVTISQAYTLPSSDGTTGQVLQTNGAGALSFTSLSSGGMLSLADDTTPQLGGDLASNGNDITFADNDKAIFGAGSDLQIYHSGSDNMIEGVANEYLFIKHDNLLVRDLGNKDQIRTAKDGAVTLYYNSGQKLATTATGIDVTGNITTTGYIAGPATLTIDPAAVGDDTGTVVIAGDLQVDGTTTTVNSATLDVADINITVAKGAANAAAANGAGLTVDGASATLTYASSGDNWAFNKPLDMGGNNITTTGQMLYSNVYSAEVDLPNASTYHGMFAHVHGTGKGYFAHSGNWIALQNENALEGDVDTHLKTTSAGIGQVLGWTGSDFNWVTMSSGLGNIVEDISPQLGGPLDVNGKVITSSSNGNIQIKPAGTGHTEFENEIQFLGTSYTTEWLSVGHWSFRDGVQARFGNTDDLVIKHDGSDSYIDETGTGNLIIKSSFLDIKDASNVELISADASEVRLRQGGNIKLKTASTGVDVTGDVSLTGSITSTAVGTPTITSSTDIVLAANSGSGIVNVSGSKITNLGTPTSTSDAATKAYVDANAGGSAFTTPEVKTLDWSVTNADKGKVYIVDTDNLTLTLPEDSTLDSDWFIRIYTKGNSFQPSFGSVGDLTIDPQYSLHGGRVNGNTNWIMRARQGGILFVDPEASDNFLFDTHSTNWDIDVNSTANANRANATGWGGVAISGQATAQGTGAVAIGYLSYATGNDSIAIGGNSAQAVATDAIALGNSYAGGTQSFAAAIDNNTSSYGALNPHSIAIGYQAKAAADRSTAIGYTAQVTGNHASAYGHGSNASGAGSNSLGYGSSATGSFANAIGSSAVATGDNSVAFTQSRAGGSASFAAAISNNSTSYGASATNAVALGYYANAAGDYSVAIGKNASATGNDTIALGGATTLVKVDGTLDVSGFKVSGDVEEKFTTLTGSSSVVTHDCSTAAIFYHTGATGDFTINLTNINSTQEYAKGIAVVVSQGATAYMPTALQIGGSVQTINWQGGSAPSGTDSGIDVISFTILNDGGTYVVLGQSVAYS